VHNVIKRHGLLIWVKAKPQSCKDFQRRRVDSMWQCDAFQFRIAGVGKVYVTGFTNDYSRYRVRSKLYFRKRKEKAVNALA
jgi:putative transposase